MNVMENSLEEYREKLKAEGIGVRQLELPVGDN